MTAQTPRELIEDAPPSPAQIAGIAVCILLNAVDGFDILSITLIAPRLTEAWSLAPSEVGVVISASLVAMGIGSLALAPLADRLGRRPVVLASLVIITVGMFGSAFSRSLTDMLIWRLLTGIGIGVMLPTINAVTAELANGKTRNLAISLMTIGYPVGGVAGGLLAAILLVHHDWHSVMLVGGAASLVTVIITFFLVPESVDFLATRRPANALQRVNDILKKFRLPPVEELPQVAADAPKSRTRDLFAKDLRPTTLVIGISYFAHIMVFYYILGWVPSIVASLGFTASHGSEVSMWMSMGGVCGAIAFGAITARFGLVRMTALVVIATVVAVIVLGHAPANLVILSSIAFILGSFAYSGVAGLYSAMATFYPAALRATGSGMALAIGRGGSAIGPILAGLLMQAQFGRSDVALIMALPGLIGGALLLYYRRRLVPR